MGGDDMKKGIRKPRSHKMLFDSGLFKQKIVELKTRYSRKEKHKGKDNG